VSRRGHEQQVAERAALAAWVTWTAWAAWVAWAAWAAWAAWSVRRQREVGGSMGSVKARSWRGVVVTALRWIVMRYVIACLWRPVRAMALTGCSSGRWRCGGRCGGDRGPWAVRQRDWGKGKGWKEKKLR
jgi:hypothetical protein